MKYTKKNGERRATYSLYLSEETHEKLREIANEQLGSMTLLCRKIINEYISKYEKQKKMKK